LDVEQITEEQRRKADEIAELIEKDKTKNLHLLEERNQDTNLLLNKIDQTIINDNDT
jgi:hypothetical protein